jgi:hypothetical protein
MTDVSDLHKDVGELRGTVSALSAEVTKLREQVENLTAVLNQGKGAKWLVLLIPSTIGVMGALLGYFGVKLSVGP